MSRAVVLATSLALVGVFVGSVAACAHGEADNSPSVAKTKSTTEPATKGDDDDGDDTSSGDGPIHTPSTTDDAGKRTEDSGTGTPPTGNCGKIVINELQAEGASASDEFIELYNAGSCAQNLAGYKVYYYAAQSTTKTATPCFDGKAGDSIGLGNSAYFVIGGTGYSGSTDADIGCGGLSKDGAHLELVDPTGKVIDGVGYGDAASTKPTEGDVAVKPGKNQSVGRKTDGLDTNDNSADFKGFTSPTPGASN